MANKSVITDISRTTTTYTTQNYQAGVYDHMAGDWSEHTQLRVQDVAFFSGAGYLTGTKTLRLQVRDPVTLAIRTFATPVIQVGGEAIGGLPPIITQQPVGGVAYRGTPFDMTVVVASTQATTFQWQKYDSSGVPQDLAGWTYNKYVISSPTSSATGDYRCLAFNSSGSVASNTVHVTYSDTPQGGGGSSLFETIVRFTLWPF